MVPGRQTMRSQAQRERDRQKSDYYDELRKIFILPYHYTPNKKYIALYHSINLKSTHL